MFKNLSKKLRKGALALPLLVGLGLTSPALAQEENYKPRGYLELAGKYVQFTGDNFLPEVYGNALGGSIGGAVRVSGPLHLGGKLSLLTGSGDYEYERGFSYENSTTQTASITGIEPYAELKGKNIFLKLVYGDYLLNDKIREQRMSWFRKYDKPQSNKQNLTGPSLEAGMEIGLDKLNSNWDGSLFFGFSKSFVKEMESVGINGGVRLSF